MPASAPRSFLAIVNPGAGGCAATLLPLARLLRRAGAEVTVEYSRGLAHAATIARDAARRGHVVLGVGGDGTVGRVAGALAGTGALCGIVPAGRGNDFARQLALPSDPAALARLLLSSRPREVDAIEVQEGSGPSTVVLGSVYAGVDAIAGRNANGARLLRGSAAYYCGALRAIATWRPAAYRVTVDGRVYERRAHTVVAANSGFYGSGLHIAPAARVDDGLLDVVIIASMPKRRFFAVMRELRDGSHVRRDQIEQVRGRQVRIEADRALPYGADGELPGALPLTARVMPGALRLLAP